MLSVEFGMMECISETDQLNYDSLQDGIMFNLAGVGISSKACASMLINSNFVTGMKNDIAG